MRLGVCGSNYAFLLISIPCVSTYLKCYSDTCTFQFLMWQVKRAHV